MSNGMGDRGQRYEVHVMQGGKDVVIGWTNNPTGGMIMHSLNVAIRSGQYPGWCEPRVVDRFPGLELLVDTSKFNTKGCKKCVSEVFAGGDHCRYCNYVFPKPQRAITA